jgi:hypothetical protein
VSEREELRAALDARRELGPEYEPQIVDSFLEKVEKRLEERAGQRAVRRGREVEHRAVTPLILGSLGLSIPLIAIAGSVGGAVGVVAVCLAIVVVNVMVILHR